MVFFGDVFPPFVDLLFYICVLVVIFIIFKVLEYLSKRTNLSSRSYKYHCWKSSKFTNQVLYCSGCGGMVDEDGFHCVCCGATSDKDCVKLVNKSFKCKEFSSQMTGPMKHHWVLGNIAVGYYCYVCEEDCSNEPGLTDYRCVWCDRTVHSRCKDILGEVCDFGTYRSFIIPPQCVEVRVPTRPRVKASVHVEKIADPAWKDWTPLFVLGNSKSGNNKGDEVLCLFRRYLNPLQVLDLCEEESSTSVLRVLSLLPSSAKPCLLVAGGDGSVAWLLSDLASFPQKVCMPPVGIIPLGTGNDLSRVLGWGSQEPSNLSAQQVFSQIRSATPVSLDRWLVEMTPCRSLRFTRSVKSEDHFMYNYLSVGVDAMVTLKFHNTRKSPFYVFSSRIINKMMYLWFGADQVLDSACKDLEDKVDLYLDGVKVDLPAVESIVILNIPSWGAGVPLWQVGQDAEDEYEYGNDEENRGEQRIDDGLLEVAGIYSSFHIAQLQVGLSQPHRIGQAKHVKLKLKKKLPMQIDGEPWMQNPGEIVISIHDQASLLKLNSS